jgi:hypothetical protein
MQQVLCAVTGNVVKDRSQTKGFSAAGIAGFTPFGDWRRSRLF